MSPLGCEKEDKGADSRHLSSHLESHSWQGGDSSRSRQQLAAYQANGAIASAGRFSALSLKSPDL